ncbi:DegT/DnrJ/EryC1/StrS family aminotransferase [Streptomyces diastatochromogenes]|nr:DegT/DnrJ/EryC1/StrS family aminotransferase [Streptomyces diastatochromogenes]
MSTPAAFPGGAGLFRLAPEVAHLNHGSFGAVPTPVARVHQDLLAEAAADPDAFFLGVPDRLAEARGRVAAHLGTDPEGLAFVTNATEAAGLALDALRLDADDEILVTDHGYGTVVAAAARRARTVTVALDPALCRTRTPCARRCSPDSPPDQGGPPRPHQLAHRPDRRGPRLLAELRERGITTVVDGAHAPGMLAEPLAGRPDFWFGNLHKWAYAPPGSAVLAVAPGHRARVPAPVPSWEDHRGFRARSSTGPPPTTRAGSPPRGPRPDRPARRRGGPRPQRRTRTPRGRVAGRAPGLTPLPYTEGLAMRSLRLPRSLARTQQEAAALREEIAARLGCRVLIWPWPDGGGIRISGQVYNRAEEYERLVAGLRRLLAEG